MIVASLLAALPLLGSSYSSPSTSKPMREGQFSQTVSSAKIRALYNSLDGNSVAQHLSFHLLYPNSIEGKAALTCAWQLMTGSMHSPRARIPFSVLQSLHLLIHKPIGQESLILNDAELQIMEQLSVKLPHRRLKGHLIESEEELLKLESAHIDVARGLLLSQFHGSERLRQIRSYEALIDMMALQIIAKLEPAAVPEAKIRAINHFIFEEMGFRFPPHSLYAKEIDLYTFLPSVLDSRQGVCLGVSTLYLCIAQRLDLTLEMITPPGHIYIRYSSPTSNQVINIETTARGIHLDSEEYLGLDTRSLQRHTKKEVIGMAHFNQASVFWQQGRFDKAIDSYLKARLYMPEDPLLGELLGYNYLFNGQKELGERELHLIVDNLPEEAVGKRNIAEDYLKGHADIEAIRIAFMHVDEKRESLVNKKKALEKVLETYPLFRMGLLQMATLWLQLQRNGEALEALERHHAIDSTDPTVEYYLAELYRDRFDYQKSWQHLKIAESLCRDRQHSPKALQELRRELSYQCPE